MEAIKIKRLDMYRDGGTKLIELEDGRIFYIDKRIGTKTSGQVYNSYPNKYSGDLLKDKALADAIIEAYNNYKLNN